MNASKANLINALALIILGAWGCYATGMASKTALIPVVGGLILLACHSGVSKQNKIIAHIAVVLTLLLILGIARPFSAALGSGEAMKIVRTGGMLLTGILAMVYFIKNFREAIKSREASE